MPTPARLTRSPTLRNTTRAQAVATVRSPPDNLTLNPNRSAEFGLYFCFILSVFSFDFFAGIAGYVKKNPKKRGR